MKQKCASVYCDRSQGFYIQCVASRQSDGVSRRQICRAIRDACVDGAGQGIEAGLRQAPRLPFQFRAQLPTDVATFGGLDQGLPNLVEQASGCCRCDGPEVFGSAADQVGLATKQPPGGWGRGLAAAGRERGRADLRTRPGSGRHRR